MPESSQKNDARESLIKYAGRILTGRPYFRFKLRQKLFLRAEKLNFSDAENIIDTILDDLQKSGYLDDQYLASAFVRRQLAKSYGPKIITFKLKQLGLDPLLISQALGSSASEEEEIVSIRKFCRKYANLDRQKLISKLYSRGYSGQVIRKVFDGDWNED